MSALGPWPGRRVLKVQQMAMDVLADVPAGVVGIPPLVQMPRRGPHAESLARTASMLPGMPVEIGPHGWRLADRPGADLAACRSVIGEDVDALAVTGLGWDGQVAVTARGPWSVAASLYLARGDRVLADHGAVRDVVDSLAEGIVEHVARVRTALPLAQPVVVLREPGLADVLAGAVATFSGHGRIPAVPGEQVAAGLSRVVAALRAAGVRRVVAHGGARHASRALTALVASGADAVGVGLGGLRPPQWEQLAAVVEQGRSLWLGLPRTAPRRGGPDVVGTADLLTRPWRAVGLPAAGLADVVLHTDTSGAGDQVLGNRQAMQLEVHAAARVAAQVAERAEAG